MKIGDDIKFFIPYTFGTEVPLGAGQEMFIGNVVAMDGDEIVVDEIRYYETLSPLSETNLNLKIKMENALEEL